MSDPVICSREGVDLPNYYSKALFLPDLTPAGYRLQIERPGASPQLLYVKGIPGLRLPSRGECVVTDSKVLVDGRPHRAPFWIYLEIDAALAVYDTREHRAQLAGSTLGARTLGALKRKTGVR